MQLPVPRQLREARDRAIALSHLPVGSQDDEPVFGRTLGVGLLRRGDLAQDRRLPLDGQRSERVVRADGQRQDEKEREKREPFSWAPV